MQKEAVVVCFEVLHQNLERHENHETTQWR